MTEQEHLYEKNNPTKYEQIQFKISEAGSKVKDKQNAGFPFLYMWPFFGVCHMFALI